MIKDVPAHIKPLVKAQIVEAEDVLVVVVVVFDGFRLAGWMAPEMSIQRIETPKDLVTFRAKALGWYVGEGVLW